MKRVSLFFLALTSAIFLSCASSKKVRLENGGKISSINELSIVPGSRVDAPRFLGVVYSKNLVKDGESVDFPVTNLIVFEPKARSAWHSHGGSGLSRTVQTIIRLESGAKVERKAFRFTVMICQSQKKESNPGLKKSESGGKAG